MTSTEKLPTLSQLSTRKRQATFVSSAHKRSCPIARKAPQDFWVAREKAIPGYSNSPWEFYKPFGGFRSGPNLVICNTSSEVCNLGISWLLTRRFNTTLHLSDRTRDSIYNQSSKAYMVFCNLCANTTGFGRYMVYLVKKAQPPAHFDTKYSALSKWKCQNWEVVYQEAML
jgi:hypothetical protein